MSGSGNGGTRRGRGVVQMLAGIVLVGFLAGCGSSATSAHAPSTTGTQTSSASGQRPSTAATDRAVGATPAAATTGTGGHALPVTVQSDAAMRAAGNQGPSSSILVPSSCTVSSSSATATGTFSGGLAPAVYARYGDVIDLYVFSAPQSGYSEGIQLASPFTPSAPSVAGKGPWSVTVPLDTQLSNADQPVRCVVAAQPTHDFEGAPSAY